MFEHEYLESILLYAVGALSGSAKEKLERHLEEGCEICEPELMIFCETADRLPYALPQRRLRPELKEKIRMRLSREHSARAPSNWKPVLLAAASVVFVVLTAALFWKQNRELLQKESEIAQVQQLLRQQKMEIEWLRDPSVQLALLTGLQPTPAAKAKMLWSPNASKGIFYCDWLPPLPAGKSYQLWVIGAKGPVSAGVFDPDSRGSAVVTVSRVSYQGGALQFAVTIEPRGGVPQPTGSMVLAGKPL